MITLSVRDYDHRLHDFVLRGNIVDWYFTTAGADHSFAYVAPDMAFEAAALRTDIKQLDALVGDRVEPVGRYRIRRDGIWFGLAHPRFPDSTFWFGPEERKDLEHLLTSLVRKVVSV